MDVVLRNGRCVSGGVGHYVPRSGRGHAFWAAHLRHEPVPQSKFRHHHFPFLAPATAAATASATAAPWAMSGIPLFASAAAPTPIAPATPSPQPAAEIRGISSLRIDAAIMYRRQRTHGFVRHLQLRVLLDS